jgi:hypothetical protein
MLNIVIPGLLWLDEAELDQCGVVLVNLKNLIRHAKITYDRDAITLNHDAIKHKVDKDFKSGKNPYLHYYSYSDFVYTMMYPACVGSLANYLAASLGVSSKHQSFLIAEPTHLRPNRDQLLISEPELLQLNADESQNIIDEINQHFTDVLHVYYITESFWLIGLNLDINSDVNDVHGGKHRDMNNPRSKWYPILDIIGGNIDDYLPSGGGAIQIIKLLNEVQMLLFNLPINHVRKSEGLLTVNSIWCWDKVLNNQGMPKSHNVFTNANLHTSMNIPIAGDITQYFSNDVLLILDDLYHPYCYQDTYSWVQKIIEYDQTVIKPLMSQLALGVIDKLCMIVPLMPHINGTIRIQISKFDKYKIFRNHKIQSILSAL